MQCMRVCHCVCGYVLVYVLYAHVHVMYVHTLHVLYTLSKHYPHCHIQHKTVGSATVVRSHCLVSHDTADKWSRHHQKELPPFSQPTVKCYHTKLGHIAM